MKKIIMIMLSIIAIIAITASVLAGEDTIAKIGSYEISEKALRECVFLNSLQSKGEIPSVEEAAQLFAKSKIAEDEIAGTSYDVSASYKKELLKRENENFDRDYKVNMAFCEQHGINRKEMIDITVRSKWIIMVEGQHLSKVIAEYSQKAGETDANRFIPPEEFSKYYEQYMKEKLSKLEYEELDEEKIKSLEKDIATFNFSGNL